MTQARLGQPTRTSWSLDSGKRAAVRFSGWIGLDNHSQRGRPRLLFSFYRALPPKPRSKRSPYMQGRFVRHGSKFTAPPAPPANGRKVHIQSWVRTHALSAVEGLVRSREGSGPIVRRLARWVRFPVFPGRPRRRLASGIILHLDGPPHVLMDLPAYRRRSPPHAHPRGLGLRGLSTFYAAHGPRAFPRPTSQCPSPPRGPTSRDADPQRQASNVFRSNARALTPDLGIQSLALALRSNVRLLHREDHAPDVALAKARGDQWLFLDGARRCGWQYRSARDTDLT
ncbi:hypothetical protein OF83DRAFT_112065 [Amylostereum chailletii]|nr:hypothetical protein OF83DRAFT_112065 [Amylostereum chailletii]